MSNTTLRAAALLSTAISCLLAQLPGQEWLPRSPRPYGVHWANAGMGGRPLVNSNRWQEWEGSGWEATMPRPPGTVGLLAVAFDPWTDRVVALASQTASAPYQTWTFDGSSWTQMGNVPASLFPLRFDPATGRLMGLTNPMSGGTQDYLWDGAIWSPLSPNLRPADVRDDIIGDPVRGRLVAIGRATSPLAGQTWEWDGTTWYQVLTTSAPPQRRRCMLGFDPATSRVLLFGGQDLAAVWLADTWTFDGSTWTNHATMNNPPAGLEGVLAWDARRGRTVALGQNSSWDWEWTGADWNPRNVLPAAAGGVQYAHAWQRARLVRVQDSETFEWDGRNWYLLATNGPPGRYGGGLAHDVFTSNTVLFGGHQLIQIGSSFNVQHRQDTWLWNGSSWTPASPVVSPPARTRHVLLPSLVSQGLILFGGQALTPFADTWLWSAGSWTDLTNTLPVAPTGGDCTGATGSLGSDPMVVSGTQLWRWIGSWQLLDSSVPPGTSRALGRIPGNDHPVLTSWDTTARRCHEFVNNTWVPRSGAPVDLDQMTWDPLRMTLLGSDQGNLYVFTATAAQETKVGSGCGTPEPRLVGAGIARIANADYRLEAFVPPSAPVLFAMAQAPAQLPLGSGCTLLLSAPVTLGFVAADARGYAAMAVPIPFIASLRGFTVHAQIADLQAGGPLSGLALSAALRIQIGD